MKFLVFRRSSAFGSLESDARNPQQAPLPGKVARFGTQPFLPPSRRRSARSAPFVRARMRDTDSPANRGQWNPTTCGFRLQHLRSSRGPGGHGASIAGAAPRGGGSKLAPADSVDAFVGCGKSADRKALPEAERDDPAHVVGFACDAAHPVRAVSPWWTEPSLRRLHLHLGRWFRRCARASRRGITAA